MNKPSRKSRLRIALVSSLDSADRRVWSGTPFYMARALEDYCGDVVPLGPVKSHYLTMGKLLHRAGRGLISRSVDYQHNLILARRYAEFFSNQLRQYSCDIVFAPAASTEIAFLKTAIPIVYATDATFRVLKDYYPFYKRMASWSARSAETIERLALKNASAVVYPTPWPVQSAVRDYGVDESDVHVVPYGPNIDSEPSIEVIRAKSVSEHCRILFVAVEWERKGGDIAFETLLELEKLGIESELTVVGCTPPRRFKHPHLRVVPFLDKNLEGDRQIFHKTLLTSDFLLLPTRAEAYGIVFCEASAFGLPSISTDTGGVSGVVTEGKNGYLLPPEARGVEYAGLIASLFVDKKKLSRLIKSSKAMYDKKLNWHAWGMEMSKIMTRLTMGAGA
jgi:glycosyltransferase involved in cell wall biosynthesis